MLRIMYVLFLTLSLISIHPTVQAEETFSYESLTGFSALIKNFITAKDEATKQPLIDKLNDFLATEEGMALSEKLKNKEAIIMSEQSEDAGGLMHDIGLISSIKFYFYIKNRMAQNDPMIIQFARYLLSPQVKNKKSHILDFFFSQYGGAGQFILQGNLINTLNDLTTTKKAEFNIFFSALKYWKKDSLLDKSNFTYLQIILESQMAILRDDHTRYLNYVEVERREIEEINREAEEEEDKYTFKRPIQESYWNQLTKLINKESKYPTSFFGKLFRKNYFKKKEFLKDFFMKTQSRPRFDNQMEVLEDGFTSFAARMESLNKATGPGDEILVISWAIYDDMTGLIFLEKLKEKKDAGVKIKIVIDGLTTNLIPYGRYKMLQRIKNIFGPKVLVEWNGNLVSDVAQNLRERTLWGADQNITVDQLEQKAFWGTHRKMQVVKYSKDGNTMYDLQIGGRNIGSEYYHIPTDFNQTTEFAERVESNDPYANAKIDLLNWLASKYPQLQDSQTQDEWAQSFKKDNHLTSDNSATTHSFLEALATMGRYNHSIDHHVTHYYEHLDYSYKYTDREIKAVGGENSVGFDAYTLINILHDGNYGVNFFDNNYSAKQLDQDIDYLLANNGRGSAAIIDTPAGSTNGLMAYSFMINSAVKGDEINIGMAYLVLTGPVLKAIRKAAKRGVKINIITNGIDSLAAKALQLSMYRTAAKLSKIDGVELALRNENLKEDDDIKISQVDDMQPTSQNINKARGKITFHEKFMVVINEKSGKYLSLVGSQNLHPRSHRFDGESSIFSMDEAVAKELRDQFMRTFNKRGTADGNLTESFEKMKEIMTDRGSAPTDFMEILENYDPKKNIMHKMIDTI